MGHSLQEELFRTKKETVLTFILNVDIKELITLSANLKVSLLKTQLQLCGMAVYRFFLRPIIILSNHLH